MTADLGLRGRTVAAQVSAVFAIRIRLEMVWLEQPNKFGRLIWLPSLVAATKHFSDWAMFGASGLPCIGCISFITSIINWRCKVETKCVSVRFRMGIAYR